MKKAAKESRKEKSAPYKTGAEKGKQGDQRGEKRESTSTT